LIGIVDYGLGNVQAFTNIYRALNIPAMPVKTADELANCSHLILPGVGAFDWAISRLSDSGMCAALNQRVLQDNIPVLGVCVGMQIMANGSEEGVLPGLGWIPGRVHRFSDSYLAKQIYLPHMGWNCINSRSDDVLFRDIESPQFYFLHSYYFQPESSDDIIAKTDYGFTFASAVRRGKVWATQFHPEKSHQWGVALLRNFSNA
jgi:imidazole glycerol-phosphate synthase subunit HisH